MAIRTLSAALPQARVETSESARINAARARIWAHLDGMERLASTVFWHDVDLVGTPLIRPGSANESERGVAFLWRASDELGGVYLSLNRVTDKERVERGMLQHVQGTDIWWVELRLPASLRASYRFFEIPQDTSAETVRQLGYRLPPLPAALDPYNHSQSVRGASVVALDQAPGQREWQGIARDMQGAVMDFYPFLAGRERRVRLYLPAIETTQPLPLLVLPDSETWLDGIKLLPALEHAMESGRLPPLALVGIDNHDIPDRVSILGGQTLLVQEIVDTLLPELRQSIPGVEWAGRRQTLLAGQSLGGVTALMAAAHAHTTFGGVIAHSPSMWWHPDGKRRPIDFSETDASWVTAEVLHQLPEDVHIRLAVGSLEGMMVPHVRHLHSELVNTGIESHLTVYTGGHDHAWWRGALIDDLEALLS